MKLKLDENLGQVALAVFCQHGHEMSTVPEQGLSSASDRTLIETCRAQQRCLVTLDLDFANPLLFRPSDYAGIAVLRLSLPHHDIRRPAEIHRADYAVSANIGRTMDAMRQGVVDVRCCLDWLESQGYNRLGIIGKGRCLGSLARRRLTPNRRGCRSSTVRSSPIGDLHRLTETAEIPSVLTTTAAGSGPS